jgi:sterol desaturase/sphingolipid hydroxylase (fatty acid hydroxylase superfamily)
MWATHSVHHSAEQMTLLSSLRLGWTNLFSAGWIVYVPLVLAGFDPLLVFTLLAFNLRYQFFLHTEAVGRLGPIEWVFNTPAHHRLHHASNPAYIDRNYGGVLIVFDRLFGTLAKEVEGEPIRYGLAHRPATANPLTLAFREWRLMLGDMWRARSLRPAILPPV